MSRSQERQNHPIEFRVVLLEGDADHHEEEIVVLEGRLSRMLGILVGILVSTTTAAILLALNLVVGT